MADAFFNRLGNVFRRPSYTETVSIPDVELAVVCNTVSDGSSAVSNLMNTSRSVKFRSILSSQQIDLTQLRDRLWSGCHNCDYNIRDLTWKFVIGYLPLRLDRQESVYQKKRAEYETLSRQYEPEIERLRSNVCDKESVLFRQIRIDIPRTCFNSNKVFKDEMFSDLMQRVLYIWALRNPACSYVQGMNDLAIPILIVLLEGKYDRDINTISADQISQLSEVESDLYWLLSKLLQDLQDHYTDSQPGIQRMNQKLKGIIQRVDGSLFHHLESEEVDFMQISFRWFNCLFTREFRHDCVLRLWDTCISEQDGFSVFIVYFAAAFLMKHSTEIKANAFQYILTLFNDSDTTRDRFDIKVIDSIIAEAYILKSLFHSSPHHLQSSAT